MHLRVYNDFTYIGNILVSYLHATFKHYINIMDIIHTESQKENDVIICQAFKFSKLKRELSSGETKWRCAVKTCNAFLKTIGEINNMKITEKNVNHRH